MKYVALVNTNQGTMWITNPNDLNPRLFDDRDFAETVAKVLSPVFHIVTEEEFKKMVEENGKTNES